VIVISVYVVSDTHFCHYNIIRFSRRPYRNTNHMNESMIRNWNSTVRERDEVIHLGDFALSNLRDIKYIRNRLNGRIYLILGNHDKSRRSMEEAGFIIIKQPHKIRNLVLTHQPLPEVYNGYVNIHGHIHEKFYSGNHINVCVEHTNYTPVSLDSLFRRANQMLRWG